MGEIMVECKDEKLKDSVFEQVIEVEGKTKNAIEIKPRLFAEQLFVFDKWIMKGLTVGDVLDQSDNFKIYSKRISCIEYITQAFLIGSEKKRKTFEFFVDVSEECVLCGEYNNAFLLFTSINSLILKFAEEWQNIGKTQAEKFKRLQMIFGISQTKFYNKHFSEYTGTKVPIIANVIAIVERSKETKLSELSGEELNKAFALKLRTVGAVIEPLYHCLNSETPFTPLADLQKFFWRCVNSN
ncbi:hypothetical protein EIN_306300 [Entamoeba invadens IP1]|uniref:Ras-GEF domain-containing protein n=1 Tax=Entamoeba invadens IP1 TaxID=370355 RepID=A0A0A1TYX7_ENTIV|nr:hypothetical protein EIN_306300 [Entamoeba invadens IP1]ELP86714.1 hypothetical protein EIN_306300 [Entamoeba invadens IP1]|eukprot:XP_004186060.1 hypothetical protein EIN_306300 [Entamoeba invadens IP1]